MTEPTLNRRPLASRSWPIMGRAAKRLAAAGATPNGISILGVVSASLGAAALAATGLASPAPWAHAALLVAAAAGIQGRLLCNLLDGMVAIEGGRKTPAGPLFNEAPDRVSDALLFAAAGLAPGSSLAAGLLAGLLAVATAYIRELGRASGAPADFGGPMAKQQRMALMTLACLALAAAEPLRSWRFGGEPARWCTLGDLQAGPWAVVLAVISVGSLLTCGRRLARAAQHLAKAGAA